MSVKNGPEHADPRCRHNHRDWHLNPANRDTHSDDSQSWPGDGAAGADIGEAGVSWAHDGGKAGWQGDAAGKRVGKGYGEGSWAASSWQNDGAGKGYGEGSKGSWGDGSKGSWGDGSKGSWGEGSKGSWGDGSKGWGDGGKGWGFAASVDGGRGDGGKGDGGKGADQDEFIRPRPKKTRLDEVILQNNQLLIIAEEINEGIQQLVQMVSFNSSTPQTPQGPPQEATVRMPPTAKVSNAAPPGSFLCFRCIFCLGFAKKTLQYLCID